MDAANGGERAGRAASIAPAAAMAAAVAAWLWPFGVGGRMPVGGDVTQFSIGLMAFLGRSLRAGRLPLWNDLWGYGFPGLAESQMGVYYPPHLLLYGLLPVEAAYTASLVLHTYWAAFGAFWMARRLGVSAWGAALAGWAWAASGFYVIHLPHQWGYTVGSWMPWAWGLAWPLARGEFGRRRLLGLAMVLAVQTLPGHFQLAFVTEVGVLGLAVWGVLSRPNGTRRALLGFAAILGALILVGPLAAAQLVPTYRLAQLAESRRDWEYLSGFAVAPLHLASYVAPGLFHVSNLWRPLAWDALRTSPEEHLGYVGLVPLFLACGAIAGGLRRDRDIRALVFLLVLSLYLSLGPNAPGFNMLVELPGFSFFRAPARWGLATMLVLALLAAKGFDRLAGGRPARATAWFALGSATAIALVVAVVELSLGGDPGQYAPLQKLDRRLGLYAIELGPTAIGLVLLLLLAAFRRLRRGYAVGLFVLALLDLGLLSRLRPVLDGPIRPLTEQSPVLARLATLPTGSRVLLAGISNLPQLAGVAALPAYRTLDLPAAPFVARAAQEASPIFQSIPPPLKEIDASARVFEPFEPGTARAMSARGIETINDSALAAWTVGASPLTAPPTWPNTYVLWPLGRTGTIAWRMSVDRFADLEATGLPYGLAAIGTPLAANRPSPERVEVRVSAGEATSVVLSQTYHPDWRATWIGNGREQPATPRPFDGWTRVDAPGPGDWTLRLEFDGREARLALLVSAAAWTLGLIGLAWPNRRPGLGGGGTDDGRGDRRCVGLHGAGAGQDPAAAPGRADHVGDLAAG